MASDYEISADRVERWGIFELTLRGSAAGNPFVETSLSARFTYRNRTVEAAGFYDGDGIYRVRFMPDTSGSWTFETASNLPELAGQRGAFTCVEPAAGNHGPVRVHNTYHFAYADGTPYYPFGTTCYAWVHQGETLEAQTLATLQTAPFNKMRMCVFPKDYVYNQNEPVYYPFVRDAGGKNDLGRFDPAFFRHLEGRIGDLRDLGIEADVILFHPYDRWGYAAMSAEEDHRYLRYVIARLAAYRNVWWSLANEYDFMRNKTMAEWDAFFRIVAEEDPYQHLRSIHNGARWYDHGKPWVTHVCVQSADVHQARNWRDDYRKPVIDDECQYEGNIPRLWGNISARELVHRFWVMAADGCYAGHGETYLHPEDILWWSKGGVLHGESWPRIAFLRRILEEAPDGGLEPLAGASAWRHIAGGMNGGYRLIYFGEHQPAAWSVGLPQEKGFTADVIDTWSMAVTPLGKTFPAGAEIPLPGKPYLALRVREIA